MLGTISDRPARVNSSSPIVRVARRPAAPLIGTCGKSYVRINAGSDYTVKPRRFADLAPLIDKSFPPSGVQPVAGPVDEAYSGAESPTRPNITVLRSWADRSGRMILGQTFGHEQRDPSGQPNDVLEIYECGTGYAALLNDLEGRDGWELYVMKPGDKVPTFDRSLMTLFCLGPEPAVLFDVANPARHRSSKRIQQQCGAAMVLSCDSRHLYVHVNPNYSDRDDGYGVLGPIPKHDLILPLPDDDRPDRIYRALVSPRNQKMLASRGICVMRPENEEIADLLGIEPGDLTSPIAGLRKDQPGPLTDYLFRKEPAEPAASPAGGILMFGPGGDLGSARIQPDVAELLPGKVDAVETFDPPGAAPTESVAAQGEPAVNKDLAPAA